MRSTITNSSTSAPRTRGLRAVAPGRQQGRGVCPAHAGVEAGPHDKCAKRDGQPRACGGRGIPCANTLSRGMSAPRTWG